ncbi:MAG: SH3 domain-containing protein [Bacteriovoracaceae bacterium]
MDNELNSRQEKSVFNKNISQILEDNEKDFDHQGIKRLFNVSVAPSKEKYQLEELRYQRFVTSQELIMDRFSKLEGTVGKIEELLEENNKISRKTKFIEEKFWESKDFSKDDRVKKATYFAFFILLAVSVGLLIPYFKSEKLVIMPPPSAVSKQAPVEEAPVVDKWVTTSFVHMRNKPSTTGKKLAMIGPNQTVEKLESKGPWIKVRVFDYTKNSSKTGWLYSDYLVKSKI